MEQQIVILGDINITNFIKAAEKFKQILQMPKDEIVRDAAIQRFEFTYELTWKTLRKILKTKGIIINNPRDVFRDSAKQGIIDDIDTWFKYIENRNNTTHVYNEQAAEEIYKSLPLFNEMVQQLIKDCLIMDK